MEGQRQKRRFWCTSFPWLQGQLLSSKPSGVKQVPSCAPALINDEECSFVKKALEAESVLSGKEMKWLVDNVWHRGENGGNGNILVRFFQNLFKLILSGKCSKEPGKAKPGFPVMSKPQITGASEPLAPQSSQAWQGRADSGTCVYKPPELFSIISFCFLTTWICLSIYHRLHRKCNPEDKVGNWLFRLRTNRGQQRGASEAWAAAPGKLLRSLESESGGLALVD